MLQRQLLHAGHDLALVIRVLGHEDLRRDVVAEQLGVDGVEDGRDEGRDEGFGGEERVGVRGREVEEGGEVGDAGGQVGGEGGGGDVLHCCWLLGLIGGGWICRVGG